MTDKCIGERDLIGQQLAAARAKAEAERGKISLGDSFSRALCEHFGLRRVLDVKVNLDPEKVFSASVDIALTPDDVEAIGRRMAGDLSQ